MTAARSPRDAVSRPGMPPILLGILAALVLAVGLFPWFPFATRLTEGGHAPWTLIAPRVLSFDSVVRTEQVRTEAAQAVPDVLVLDPAVRDRELAELDRQVALIEQFRTAPSLVGSVRESSIRIASPALSPAAAQTWAVAPPEEFALMTAEARGALGRTLSGALRTTDLEAARGRATGFLSPQLAAPQAQAISALLAPLVAPTLVTDQQRTTALRAEARQGQPPVHVSHGRGDVLVTEGQPLTAADLELLQVAGLASGRMRLGEIVAALLMAALIGVGVAGYVTTVRPMALRTAARQLLYVALLGVTVLAIKLLLPLALPDLNRQFLAYAFPFAAAPLIAAVLLDAGPALMLALLLATASAFVSSYLPLTQGDAVGGLDAVRTGLVTAVSSCAALLLAARAERPQRYLLASAAAAAATATVLFVIWCIDADRSLRDLQWLATAAVANGVLTAGISMSAIALLSRPFGIVTRVQLMELTQLSQPLLRRLQDEAPGTFQHSVVVGNLAERAAERIGADPLLVRIGAYYHDVGKLTAPPFFIENSGETNPHDALDPLQSTRVILGHVTAGVQIAREAGLPEAVVAFIPQHHGTRLAVFFYRRAAESDPNVDPERFRYPGPRPQSRETALVMLADASEAVVRASADRSPDRIRELVETVIRERVEEGQFDDCELSLHDLRVVADSYASALNAVYHPRVEYPQPTARELAGRRGVQRIEAGDAPESR